MKKESQDFVSEVSTNFKRGTTEMLLLAILTQQDRYVYELSKLLKEMSMGLFDIQGPSMYTVLYRMEAHGFVSTWTEPVGKKQRVYYHILPAGRAYLQQITEAYHSISDGVSAVLAATIEKPEEVQE